MSLHAIPGELWQRSERWTPLHMPFAIVVNQEGNQIRVFQSTGHVVLYDRMHFAYYWTKVQ